MRYRNQGIMIDSGSTFTYLTSSEYRVFVQAMVTSLAENMARFHVSFPKVTRFRVSVFHALHSRSTTAIDCEPWMTSPSFPRCSSRSKMTASLLSRVVFTCLKPKAPSIALASIQTL